MSILSIIFLSLVKKLCHLNQERNMHRSSCVYKWEQYKTVLYKMLVGGWVTDNGLFYWWKHYYELWTCILVRSNDCNLGSVLRTSLITSEIKWHIQDDIIALIRIWLTRFFERTCCWWLVWYDWVIWWFERGYVSILETTISNAVIGWRQDSRVMTSYH